MQYYAIIIEISQSNESYMIGDIPVLKNTCENKLIGGSVKKVYTGEYRKVLGIYYCGSIKHYVMKNWQEVYLKCIK